MARQHVTCPPLQAKNPVLLITGLGNPGAQYRGNRHNIGFMAVDAMARAHGFPAFRAKFHGLASEGVIAGEKVLLLKPETFMNESGRAVGEAMRWLKLSLDEIVVLHDELDLPPGKLRAKKGGGNAGHNGLRSISALVGNDYRRLRIGIGHPGDKALVHGYVLSDFDSGERAWVGAMCETLSKGAEILLRGEDASLQTRVDVAMRALAPFK